MSTTCTNTTCGCSATEGCDCFGNGVTIPNGPTGANGLSAYEIWLEVNSYSASDYSYQDFLDSLVGATGATGDTGATGPQGPAGTATPLVWNNLTLINGWTGTALPNQTPQYSVDEYDVIRFRGVLDPSAKSSDSFADLSAVITSNTRLHNGMAMNINQDLSYFYITDADLVTSSCATGFVLYLESASSFYIGD